MSASAIVDLLEAKNPGIWSAEKVLTRGEFLTKAGDYENHIYLITSGAVRAFVVLENKEHIIRLGYKGNIINALPSFISGKKSALYLEALKKTTFSEANKTAALNAIQSSAELQQIWQKTLENLAIQQHERELDLLCQNPETRYKRVLMRSPKLFQEIPAKYIADYLRMSPETLSRLKKS